MDGSGSRPLGLVDVIEAIRADPEAVGRILGFDYGRGEPGSGQLIRNLVRGIYEGSKYTAPLPDQNPHLEAVAALSDAAVDIELLGMRRDLAHRDHRPDPAFTDRGILDPHRPPGA